MHIRVVLPIVALLFTWAGTTYAQKSQEDSFEMQCILEADHAFPRVPGRRPGPELRIARAQYYQQCMQKHWAGSVTDDKCPYRDVVSCRCYNGCVKATWRDNEDVGAYCHAQCKPI
ncbi:hypothetical protein V8E36_005252 [Tilletia maclaganii]